MRLDVNTDAVVKFANKLEQLNRSAFPVAVRGTLNGAAFDVKTNTMPKTASEIFTQRKPNFFKATSRVEKAAGFDVNTMKSTVGFQGNQQAVDDLEQQEKGGKIGSRSFIPMTPARVGNAKNKVIRSNARLSKMKFVDARKAKGKNDRQKFVKSVHHAGAGGNVLSEWKGKTILWRVNSLKRNEEGGLKLTPLYSFVKGRAVQIKKTNFMEKASLQSAAKMEQLFIKEANRQFAKALK